MERALENTVRETILKYQLLERGEKVLLGVSGGADSVCLLDVMCGLAEEFQLALPVVHVDHGIRETAARDASFVRELAERRGLPYYEEQVDVPALRVKWRCSEEDAARRARYDAFRRVMEGIGADKLALAHHRDDQAETLLLHLCRGAGLRGMAGMAPIRDRIIRPLLFVPRQEIEEYLTKRQLPHVEDETNASDAYARNRVRRHLIPCAEEIHPGAAAHLAEATGRVREALAYLDEETQRGLAACRVPDGLSLAILRQLPPFLQGEILLAALREQGVHADIGERHLAALKDLIATDDGTQALDLPGGLRAVRRYGTLHLIHGGDDETPESVNRAAVDAPVMRIIERTPGTPFERSEIPTDPFTKWFDFDKIKQSVCIRTRRAGDRIETGAGRKSLKKEMIDCKIPADQRDRIPLLAAGDEILWIIGVRRSEAYRVTDETARVLEVQFVRRD